MRWNLQVRASVVAAPPSATEPAPSQALAAASRVLRAGSESGLRLAAAAGPARCARGLRRRLMQVLAAGTTERSLGAAASRRGRKMAAGWRN